MSGLSIGTLFGYLTLDSAKFDTGVTGAQAKMKEASVSAGRLGSAVSKVEASMAGAGREADVAARGSARLKAAQLSAVAAQERYNTAVKSGTASLGKTASAQASLIRANDRLAIAQEKTAVTQRHLGAGMAGSAISAAKLGLSFAGLALLFEGGKMVSAATTFQKQMLLIQTQAGATAAEVKKMTPAILSLAGKTGTAPEALATSLYHVESIGLRAGKALDLVTLAAEGAKVGNANLEETTNALTVMIASGIKGAQNFSQAMGVINAVVGAGDMKMSDFNATMGSGLLPTAKQFGISLNDVGAGLATFGDLNMRGADAATALRMSIYALAKPVIGGESELKKLGLTSKQLATDMSTGGLGKALDDLKAHMTAAGITGDKMGSVLLNAFGKKAGPGISIMVDQLDRFHQKQKIVAEGANKFGAAWEATTKNAAFGFDRLKAETEAAGISLYTKLLPPLSKAAGWLATELPRAISAVQKAFQTLMTYIGGPLHAVWTGLGVVIKAARDVLEGVALVISRNQGLFRGLAEVILGVWVAFRGYAIATTAIEAVRSAFLLMEAAGNTAMGGIGAAINPVTLAVVGIGVVLGLGLGAWLKHKQVAQAALEAEKALVEGLTQAIEEDNGAIASNTQAFIVNELQKNGALDAGRRLGLNLHTLTLAMEGNTKAWYDLITPMAAAAGQSKQGAKDADALTKMYVDQNGALKDAVQAYKNKQAASGDDVKALHAQEVALSKNKPAYAAYVRNLEQAGVHAGITKGQVDKYLTSLGKTPLSIVTKLGLDKAQAAANLVAVLAQILNVKLTAAQRTELGLDTSAASAKMNTLLSQIYNLKNAAASVSVNTPAAKPGVPSLLGLNPFAGGPKPHKTAGGTNNYSGGLSWLGDGGGPELVFGPSLHANLAPGSTVVPADQTARMMGGGNSPQSMREAINGASFVLDAGSLGMLTGHIDARAHGAVTHGFNQLANARNYG